MEDLPKAFVKVLMTAMIKLEFYEDTELSYEDVLDQADGRSSLTREGLSAQCQKYLKLFKDLSSHNPSNLQGFLKGAQLSNNETSAAEEVWAEEKSLILRKHLEKREIEWIVKGEPSWSIDIQTIGKNTESTTVPVANFKFELNRFDKDRTLQFSADKGMIKQLMSSLEQANLYLSSNLFS